MSEITTIKTHKKVWFYHRNAYSDALAKSALIGFIVLVTQPIFLQLQYPQENLDLLRDLFSLLVTTGFAFIPILLFVFLIKNIVNKFTKTFFTLFVFILAVGVASDYTISFEVRWIALATCIIVFVNSVYMQIPNDQELGIFKYSNIVFFCLAIILGVILTIHPNLWLQLIITFSPLIFTVLFALTAFLYTKVLHVQETAYLKQQDSKGIQFMCLSCANTISPVLCHCPACYKKHEPVLMPSQYGIHHHNCLHCNYKLSTNLAMRKIQGLRPYCPDCGDTVNNSRGVSKHLFLMGDVSSEKIFLQFHMLDFLVKKYNASFINTTQNTHFLKARKSLKTTQSIQAFQVKNRYNALTVNLKPNQKAIPFELHLHDITGNKSEAISIPEEYPFFKKANSILFIINPYHVPAFGKKRGIIEDDSSPKQIPLMAFRALLQILEKYNSPKAIKQIDFNIILTKTNTGYLNTLRSEITDSTSRNTVLERFVKKELEGDAFIHHIKQQFKSIDFYAIDAISGENKPAIEASDLEVIMKEVCRDIDVKL